jgi:hypothetical protein
MAAFHSTKNNINASYEEIYDTDNKCKFVKCYFEDISKKGQDVIKPWLNNIVFIHEDYAWIHHMQLGKREIVHDRYFWGDKDEFVITEHMWSLYFIIKEDGVYKYHKFYREVFENRGDNDEEIYYVEVGLSEQEKARMPKYVREYIHTFEEVEVE